MSYLFYIDDNNMCELGFPEIDVYFRFANIWHLHGHNCTREDIIAAFLYYESVEMERPGKPTLMINTREYIPFLEEYLGIEIECVAELTDNQEFLDEGYSVYPNDGFVEYVQYFSAEEDDAIDSE